jgi:DNA-directed RNA polymerase subunit H (RpoH/RPB5)
MLADRGEDTSALDTLEDAEIEKRVQDAIGTQKYVRFDTGSRDIVFFLTKIKSPDIAAAASETDKDRVLNALIVTPNVPIRVHMVAVHTHFGPGTETFVGANLGINIARHVLVPKHEIVPRADMDALKKRLQVSSFAQLPLIDSADPMAKYVRARPGDIVCITRVCPTSGTQIAYRYCRR